MEDVNEGLERDSDAVDAPEEGILPTLHERVTNIEKVLRKLLHEVQDLGIEIILG